MATAQSPSWHVVPAEDLLGNRGEIAKTLHTTKDETTLLQIWQRPEVDEDILYLKMLAAKRLGIYGTKAAVPILVARLDNDKDSFFARYALEMIPGEEIDIALCEALKKIEKPQMLTGILTTLGVRGNPAAKDAVKPFLTHKDTDVRKAAGYAYALTAGESGTAFFTAANLDPLLVDSGFLFAEQFAAKGDNAAAVKVYDALNRVTHAKEFQKMAAIYQGALARGLDGAGWLYRQITAETPRRLFEVGLKAGRELPADRTGTVAIGLSEIFLRSRTDPYRQARIVRAAGDRKDETSKAMALPVLISFARGERFGSEMSGMSVDVVVRVAAIDALRNVGNASVVPVLIEAANSEEESVAEAARNTLAYLPGKEVDDAICGFLETGTPAVKVTALNLVAERLIFTAAPTVRKLQRSSETSVSVAATKALEQIPGIEELPQLLGKLRLVTTEEETQKVLIVLKSAYTRFPQDDSAAIVAKELENASTEFKTKLLDLLKEIAGAKSLAIVESYAWGPDATMRNVATEILGKWRSPQDLDQLAAACLKVAKESEEYKIRGLRGYIRLARQFDMPEERKLSMCQEVFDLADRDADKILIFDVYARVISIASLEKAVSYLDNATFRERAADSAVAICEKLQGKDPKITEAMKKVLQVSTNDLVKGRAQRVLERQ